MHFFVTPDWITNPGLVVKNIFFRNFRKEDKIRRFRWARRQGLILKNVKLLKNSLQIEELRRENIRLRSEKEKFEALEQNLHEKERILQDNIPTFNFNNKENFQQELVNSMLQNCRLSSKISDQKNSSLKNQRSNNRFQSQKTRHSSLTTFPPNSKKTTLISSEKLKN